MSDGSGNCLSQKTRGELAARGTTGEIVELLELGRRAGTIDASADSRTLLKALAR
jgi:hypothetical protein